MDREQSRKPSSGCPEPSFIAAIRRRRFESFSKELKKGMRITAGEHLVRSFHVSAAPVRNRWTTTMSTFGNRRKRLAPFFERMP
jgi:hypothetical protein